MFQVRQQMEKVAQEEGLQKDLEVVGDGNLMIDVEVSWIFCVINNV